MKENNSHDQQGQAAPAQAGMSSWGCPHMTSTRAEQKLRRRVALQFYDACNVIRNAKVVERQSKVASNF
jgi:hypothetical protein